MEAVRRIAQAAAFQPPLFVAGELEPLSNRLRRSAEQLISAVAPPALARHWIHMRPVEDDDKSSPFTDLADALTAVLENPVGVVSLSICRSFPAAKLNAIGAPAVRFGFRNAATATAAKYRVDDFVVNVTLPANFLHRLAERIRA